VKVPNDEELANHIVPESCAAYREVRREALTGVHTGQPLSRERRMNPGADTVSEVQGNTAGRDKRECPSRPGVVVEPGMCARSLLWEPGDLWFDQPLQAGPHWEGEEPKPMMHEPEKSDSAVVAVKLANKTAVSKAVAELVEPRAGTKGNTQQSHTRADPVPR
jgi:hypothetical protein